MAAYCVLTYPTLEHWLTTAHLDSNSDSEQASAQSAILRAAESTSTHLTIVVRTAETAALPSPWDPASPSSSSSSSGGGAGEPPSPSPTRFFLRLERALARVYSIATDSFAQRDLVLAQVDVVLEQLRRQPVCVPSSSSSATTVIRWQTKDDSVDTPVNENGEHKGKGKETNPANHAHSGADHHHHHHDPHLKTLYPVVALGGTFDHLHSGHKILLTMAASITSRKLIVGVTDDALLKTKKFREWLEPLPFRIRNVENFIALIRPEIECACVPLQDVYGPTATDPEIEALVVSDETRAGGQAINTLRASRSLSILRIFCIALVAESTPSRVPSSTNLPAEALPTNKVGGEEEEEEEEVEGKVVVSPATKMGSTGIREWLSKRRQEEQQRTGA
ncbi:hypothetical protein B0A53_04730 [Rhodotorula sp. CCFEE 5036]|nr:hypothetical protein B0A53_04730 [Rhodotorula sp. CCFEE 5036]